MQLIESIWHVARLQASRGDWVLFMDDDNYAKAHEIMTFVIAANNTGAEVTLYSICNLSCICFVLLFALRDAGLDLLQ